jgi:hypothetical protein
MAELDTHVQATSESSRSRSRVWATLVDSTSSHSEHASQCRLREALWLARASGVREASHLSWAASARRLVAPSVAHQAQMIRPSNSHNTGSRDAALARVATTGGCLFASSCGARLPPCFRRSDQKRTQGRHTNEIATNVTPPKGPTATAESWYSRAYELRANALQSRVDLTHPPF